MGTAASHADADHLLHGSARRDHLSRELGDSVGQGPVDIGERAFQAEGTVKANVQKWEPRGCVPGAMRRLAAWSEQRLGVRWMRVVRGISGGGRQHTSNTGPCGHQQALCLTLFTGLNSVPQIHVPPRASGCDFIWK